MLIFFFTYISPDKLQGYNLSPALYQNELHPVFDHLLNAVQPINATRNRPKSLVTWSSPGLSFFSMTHFCFSRQIVRLHNGFSRATLVENQQKQDSNKTLASTNTDTKTLFLWKKPCRLKASLSDANLNSHATAWDLRAFWLSLNKNRTAFLLCFNNNTMH